MVKTLSKKRSRLRKL